MSANIRGPIAWMARHGVAPNILMVFLVIGGLFMTTQVKQEIFPNFDPDTVTIIAPFPGASPEEVEEGIVLAIEEEVRGLDGVDEVHAVASEGRALITVEILLGSDPQKVNQDIQQAVDRIRVFPEEAEDPIIALSTRRRSVIEMQVFGDMDEWSLRQAAEQVRDGLLQHPEISQVDLDGVKDLEIHIEVPQHRLREHNLSLDTIGRIVRQSAFDRSGGKVETRGGEILLRVQERRDWARDFENIPIISSPKPAPSSGLATSQRSARVSRIAIPTPPSRAARHRDDGVSRGRPDAHRRGGRGLGVHAPHPGVASAGCGLAIVDDDSKSTGSAWSFS